MIRIVALTACAGLVAPGLASSAGGQPRAGATCTAQAPAAASSGGGAVIVPSRTWECAVGAYPYTSHQKLVTAGRPILFEGGAWTGQKGEFAPAGTVTTQGRPPITVDNAYVDGGLNDSYYPVTCYPK